MRFHVIPTWRKPSALVMAVLLICLLAQLTLTPVRAHGDLVRSEPASGSIQGSPPTRVDLWFSEDLEASRSTAEVYSEDQQRVDTGQPEVDANDPTHLILPLHELVDGTYTVAWRSASQEDGHIIRGTFSFRVGQSRLPGGAATVEGETPSALAVGLRWGTLAGLALVAGWFLTLLLGAAASRRGWLVGVVGAGLALIADLALVPLEAFRPSGGLPSQSLSSALTLMHDGWFVRIGLEVVILLAAGVLWRRLGQRGLAVVGVILAGAAVLTLTFTSHAAAVDSNRAVAMVINALHLESTAFWIGGVVQLALVREARGVTRRFSPVALLLALTALVTGAVNAGFLLPTLASLWRSDYGRLLLLKTAVVAGILVFAWINRHALRALAAHALRLGRALRAEAVLGATTILLASVLALSATPGPPKDTTLHLRVGLGDDRYAHLLVERPDTGKRDYSVWLSDKDGTPLDEVSGITANFSMLEQTVDLSTKSAVLEPDGRWTLADVPLNVKGWWQADLTFRTGASEIRQASFVFLLPDPTLIGPDYDRPEDTVAAARFEDAFDRMLALRSMRAREVLADGIGNSVTTDYEWAAPDRMTYSTSSRHYSVAINETQYYREGGGAWTSRQRVNPVAFPEPMRGYYSGADQIAFGRQVNVDGRTYQIVTFHVPGMPGRDESWYVWWVDTETGLVGREAMAAEYHYMSNVFTDFDQPIEIAAPVVASN